MNPFEFVLAVLILTFAFTIIRHKLGIPTRSMRQMRDGGGRGRGEGRNIGQAAPAEEQRERGDQNRSHRVRGRRAHAAIVLGPWRPRRRPCAIVPP